MRVDVLSRGVCSGAFVQSHQKSRVTPRLWGGALCWPRHPSPTRAGRERVIWFLFWQSVLSPLRRRRRRGVLRAQGKSGERRDPTFYLRGRECVMTRALDRIGSSVPPHDGRGCAVGCVIPRPSAGGEEDQFLVLGFFFGNVVTAPASGGNAVGGCALSAYRNPNAT